MKIYILDDIVTDAYLKYKHTWLQEDFEKKLQLISNNKYQYGWEEGENWAVLSLDSEIIAMLCANVPFMITDNEELQRWTYRLFPFILVQKVMNFGEDKIILNHNVCRLTIEPCSAISQEPMCIYDFYVSTI